MDLTYDYQASSYAVRALETVEPDALILVGEEELEGLEVTKVGPLWQVTLP